MAIKLLLIVNIVSITINMLLVVKIAKSASIKL